MNKLLLVAALAVAAGSASARVVTGNAAEPFNLSDGGVIQRMMPVPMSKITGMIETTRGATFKSTVPCAATSNRGWNVVGGKTLYAFQQGKAGVWEGCAKENMLGHDSVIWGDGSQSLIMKTSWEDIPNYMKSNPRHR